MASARREELRHASPKEAEASSNEHSHQGKPTHQE